MAQIYIKHNELRRHIYTDGAAETLVKEGMIVMERQKW
jgi:hypothetical protein